MKLNHILAGACVFGAMATTAIAQDSNFSARIDGLAAGWAHANYEARDKAERIVESAKVAQEAEMLAVQNPRRAEPLVWESIALATEGGARGGLGGLGLARHARDLLTKAEGINPAALGDASVYTTLGSLYAQVPGFPIGYGDPAKARSYFQKALAMNPSGIDPNFFYGDFLMRQGDYPGAIRALEKALAAPPRPGRSVADRGRRAEAAALLAQARAKVRA